MAKKSLVPAGQGFLFDHTHLYEDGSEPWEGSALTTGDAVEDFKFTLLAADLVYIDFETTSAATRTCQITGIAVGAGGEHRYLPVRTMPMDPSLSWEAEIAPMLDEVVALGKTIVVHNGQFDLALWRRFGLREPTEWEDTMIMAWMSDPHRRKGLKVLAKGILDMDAESYAKTVGKDKHDLSQVPLERSAQYAADDTRMCEELLPVLKTELEDKKLWGQYLYAKRQVGLVQWVEEGGIPMDRERLQGMRDECETYMKATVQEATERMRVLAQERRYAMIAQKLRDPEGQVARWPREISPEKLYCVAGMLDEAEIENLDPADYWSLGKEYFSRGKRRRNDPHELNLRSTEQMTQFMFNTLCLPTDKYENIKEGINKPMLIRLRRDGIELADTLLRFSRANKLLGGFFEPLLAALEERDGWWWLHGQFNPFGTATGRWSSRSPNLQNIVNAVKKLAWTQVRAAFAAPPGWKLVVGDLSQIELRLIAHYSRDPMLRKIYQEGGDIHAMTGAKLAQVPYEEFSTWAPPEELNVDEYSEQQRQYTEWRKRAKPVNFGVSYRMAAPKFRNYAADQYDVWITVEEAQKYIDDFFTLYAGIKTYHNAVQDQIIARGFVPTIGRRKAFFDPDLARVVKDNNRRDPNYWKGDAQWRQAVNFPIQGSASDLMVTGMFTMQDRFQGSGYAKLISQVHDEVILLVKEEQALPVAASVKQAMESTAVLDGIPLKSSVKVGDNWLQCH